MDEFECEHEEISENGICEHCGKDMWEDSIIVDELLDEEWDAMVY